MQELERPQFVGRDRGDQGDGGDACEDEARAGNDLEVRDLDRSAGRRRLEELSGWDGYVCHGPILNDDAGSLAC